MYLKLLSLFTLLTGISNAASQMVTRAYCGQDGKAHVVYADHSMKTMSPEEKQVGCNDMFVADDHRTFGWSMEIENCCTSYPISVAVVVVRDGNKTVLRSDQMVWQWHFLDNGNRIAMLSGPVHGRATEADLYDAHSGKKLATWLGSDNAPSWADGWQDQFASDTN